MENLEISRKSDGQVPQVSEEMSQDHFQTQQNGDWKADFMEASPEPLATFVVT